MLEAEQSGDKALEREKVVSLMIARAHRLQSLLELRRWYKKAADLSFAMKRYKDAAKYLAALQDLIGEFRGEVVLRSVHHKKSPLYEADDETEL
jgi:hypothetical protein